MRGPAVLVIGLAITVITVFGVRYAVRTLRLVAGLAPVAVAGRCRDFLVTLRVHYATDTVAGCCVALATVLAVALCLDFFGPRFRRSPLQQ